MSQTVIYLERTHVVEDLCRRLFLLFRKVIRDNFKETVSTENIQDTVKRIVYEVEQEYPDLTDRELYEKSLKACKRELWGRGSAAFDRLKRHRRSRERQKLFTEQIIVYRGQELKPFSIVPVLPAELEETVPPKLEELYRMLYEVGGHEAAILFVLNKGYGVSLRQLVVDLLGVTDTSEQQKLQIRIHRIINAVANTIRAKLNVSGESRKLLNL